MNKLLILSAMAFFAALMPIVPALACFPDPDADADAEIETNKVAFQFGREPIPMSFCDSGEVGFVVVNGKCYDQDAITDYETEEECEADDVCKAYREEQKEREPKYDSCGCPILPGTDCPHMACEVPDPEPLPPSPRPGPILDTFEDLGMKNPDRTDDPNHGEIKGDEELVEDEEEQQGEEESKEEEPEETVETE